MIVVFFFPTKPRNCYSSRGGRQLRALDKRCLLQRATATAVSIGTNTFLLNELLLLSLLLFLLLLFLNQTPVMGEMVDFGLPLLL